MARFLPGTAWAVTDPETGTDVRFNHRSQNLLMINASLSDGQMPVPWPECGLLRLEFPCENEPEHNIRKSRGHSCWSPATTARAPPRGLVEATG